MSLLHVIMMIRMTLPVVSYINRTADVGNSYCLKELETFFPCFLSVSSLGV
jgi:hypothetical protein